MLSAHTAHRPLRVRAVNAVETHSVALPEPGLRHDRTVREIDLHLHLLRSLIGKLIQSPYVSRGQARICPVKCRRLGRRETVRTVAALAAVLLGGDRSTAALGRPHAAPVTCVAPVRPNVLAPESALAAVRRALRRQTLTNQSGRIRLTPGNYAIDDVVSLGPGVSGATPRRYFKLVRSRCGELQAERTWLVTVTLTHAQLILDPLYFLTTRTKTGWKVTLQSYELQGG